MKNLIRKILPKKSRFVGIDIGAHQVKAAEIKIIDGLPEVVSLRRHPAPPGVWTEQFDEESLVQALKEVANPQLKEVITCAGGEKVISRIIRFPQMPDKELEAAVKFEIQKFVPTPVDQLIIRHVPLEGTAGDQEKDSKIKIHIPRTGETREISGKQEEGQDVLLLAVPAATVFQYYSLFFRAGLVVMAVDLKAFALWRIFKGIAKGTFAIADIGEKTSHLVVVRDGLIDFIRVLPAGGNSLTESIMNSYGVDAPEAVHLKMEAAVALDNDDGEGHSYSEVLHEGLLEITKEMHRSLQFYTSQENAAAEKLIITGETSKMTGLTVFLQEALGLPVEVGVPQVDFAGGIAFDPAFSVAIGLALREVME
jgi:type IV pilus assembly protein PilM